MNPNALLFFGKTSWDLPIRFSTTALFQNECKSEVDYKINLKKSSIFCLFKCEFSVYRFEGKLGPAKSCFAKIMQIQHKYCRTGFLAAVATIS